jgi:soluble lytic murein transglycosylase-like protein
MGEILLAGLPLSTPDERTGYHYFLSHLSYAMGQPAEGVRHAQYLLDGTKSYPTLSLPREVLVLLYPRVYMEEIEGFFSEGQKPYDRHLVLAIMREESRYNHLARSPRGALGLMQLMPATASWIVNRNLSEDDLYRPETNIETAVAYLDYLTDRFDGLEYVVASYNGGPNAVRRWMRNLGSRSVEQFVEEIPYVETRNFVKRVYTSYRMYMHLYGSPQSAGGSGNESML